MNKNGICNFPPKVNIELGQGFAIYDHEFELPAEKVKPWISGLLSWNLRLLSQNLELLDSCHGLQDSCPGDLESWSSLRIKQNFDLCVLLHKTTKQINYELYILGFDKIFLNILLVLHTMPEKSQMSPSLLSVTTSKNRIISPLVDSVIPRTPRKRANSGHNNNIGFASLPYSARSCQLVGEFPQPEAPFDNNINHILYKNQCIQDI